MSTSNMLWNMVKALYFFGCMTVACAQLSAAGSLAAAGGLSATNIPIGDELLETNTGGRLRHGHRLNRAGRRPRLHTNTSRSYKQLLSYVSNGLQGHLPKNTSDVPKCSCVMDGQEGDLNVAVLKITLVILGLWAISAGSPLYKGVYRSLKKGCRTCDVYLLVSGSFEFLLKLGNLPGHRLDYVFSATEGLRITDAYGLVSCTVHLSTPLMVTDSISGTMKMFGREVKSDPVSNYLFNKLKRDGLINYEVVISFRGGPCYAVDVDKVNDPDCPGLGDSTNLDTTHWSVNSRELPLHV